ncbi:MAG: thiamine-phosphate kinase [Pseudomonadota bacterium]
MSRDLEEDALIAQILAPLATDPGADGLLDDAATVRAGMEDIVVSCDALAAGVHFFPDDPADVIAAKALRVNLSDIAAKGAKPFGYLLALAAGEETDLAWAGAFAKGLEADNKRYDVALLGGDTLRACAGGGTTLSVTAFGRLPRGTIVRRRTALPGDVLVVTGSIGDSALGVRLRLGNAPFVVAPAHADRLVQRYLLPDPPVLLAATVRRHARAAMDISDGLLADCLKLCQAAKVGADVEVDRVPFSHAVRAAISDEPAARDIALTGGDDYQILAAIPEEAVDAFRADSADVGVRTTVIGRIREGEAAVTTLQDGVPITVQDSRFRHF